VITPTIANGQYTYALGDVVAGRSGALLLRTGLSFTTPAGSMLTNQASVSAGDDVNATNNTSVVTLSVPALPPIITQPRSGTTCTGTLTLRGKAQAGTTVGIAVDESDVGETVASTSGDWAFDLSIDAGQHRIEARTRGIDNTLRRSPHVVLNVDPNLNWDPLSLTFSDGSGTLQHAHHWMGWLQATGFYVALVPSTTYTITVRACCEGAATMTATVPGSGDVVLTDPDGDGLHTATFRTGPARALVSGPFKLCVTGDGETQCALGRVVPLPPAGGAHSGRRHTIVIAHGVAEPRRVAVARGDVIEIVNLDDAARSLTPRRTALQAETSAAASADGDAFALDVGESYQFEVTDARTTQYVDRASGADVLTVAAAAQIYLPLATR
jgi:hypothetical protein